MPKVSTSDFQIEVGEVFGEIGGELPAKFGRRFSSFLESIAGENRQKRFPPKLHRKFHHQTSLRGSGLWWALQKGVVLIRGFSKFSSRGSVVFVVPRNTRICSIYRVTGNLYITVITCLELISALHYSLYRKNASAEIISLLYIALS